MGVECSNFINHNQVQVLCYNKYSLLFLPVVKIEPSTSRWFHFGSSLTKCLYLLHHVSCWTIQREFWEFINLMSLSTYEILFITIMYDFYLSSYCNFNFFFNLPFLIIGSLSYLSLYFVYSTDHRSENFQL